MIGPEERVAFFDAIARGEEPPVPTRSLEFLPHGALVDAKLLVRHLAGVLPEAETGALYATLASSPETRCHLVDVSKILDSLQSKVISEVMRLRSEPTLQGEVATAWLSVASESLMLLGSLFGKGARVFLADLVQQARKELGSDAIVKLIFSGPSIKPTTAAAMYRSEPDLMVEGVLDEEGELKVTVLTAPEKAAEWEGRSIEVSIRVEYPVVIGVGTLRNGRLDLQVPGAGSIIGREHGPISSNDLLVGDPEPDPEPLTLKPLRTGPPPHHDPPRLVSWPSIRQGRLEAKVVIPRNFLQANLGKTVDILACLTIDRWQKIHEFQLVDDLEAYDMSIPWPDTEGISGQIPLRLQYRVST